MNRKKLELIIGYGVITSLAVLTMEPDIVSGKLRQKHQSEHQSVIPPAIRNFHPNYPVHIIPTTEKGEAASTNVREICAGKGVYKSVPHVGGTYSQNHRLSQNPETKHLVMEQSGVPIADELYYEDDHYWPLGLGGSDSINNRWAQPRFGTWNAGQKDKLETWSTEDVCNDKLQYATAAKWFQTKYTPDWRVPYCMMATKHGEPDEACERL